jgi:hypothetical protein
MYQSGRFALVTKVQSSIPTILDAQTCLLNLWFEEGLFCFNVPGQHFMRPDEEIMRLLVMIIIASYDCRAEFEVPLWPQTLHHHQPTWVYRP